MDGRAWLFGVQWACFRSWVMEPSGGHYVGNETKGAQLLQLRGVTEGSMNEWLRMERWWNDTEYRSTLGWTAERLARVPKWHTERFPWHARFTAAPIFFYFFCRTSVSVLWRICVCVCVCVWVCVYTHTHTPDCLETVYELPLLPNKLETRGSAVGWGTALQFVRSRVRFPMVSLEFIIDIILLAALTHSGPGVDSASDRNWYQEYFLGGKGGRCVGLTTLTPSCSDCLEIWEPQLPGNLWACPGL